MAIREDIVASAVNFLQDPSVTGSPLENRIAFLQSKNLTKEEVDVALARAGGDPAPNFSNYAPQQQVARQPQASYGGYQQHSWQQPPPLEVPRRDWRDWFIMATVMGGVSYGLYTVAKRYVYPMIAPPTTPQLEQDKQAIDDSFEKAFALIDQLAKDTEALKLAEQSRTERLDTALTEVERVISELKTASRDREQESRRINDEVRGLKDLIPKAIDGQKESTDIRLKELNTELKSLKTLMGQRMSLPPAPSTNNSYSRPGASSSTPAPNDGLNGSSSSETVTPKPASVSGAAGTEAVASTQGRSSPFSPSTGSYGSKAAIPSWQMAAANKTTTSATTSGVDNPST